MSLSLLQFEKTEFQNADHSYFSSLKKDLKQVQLSNFNQYNVNSKFLRNTESY